jgi:hypothetical protein
MLIVKRKWRIIFVVFVNFMMAMNPNIFGIVSNVVFVELEV